MRYDTGRLLFSPSDLVTFLHGDFASWMDRWHAERSNGNDAVANEFGLPIAITLPGVKCSPDEKDDELKLIAEEGMEHEKAFLKTLQDAGHDVEIIEGPDSERAHRTSQAMRSGVAFVYQGHLQHEDFGGLADFLAREPGESLLGDFHYEVWDTKLARSFKPYFVIQLCSYSDMIVAVQGRLPVNFLAVLGNGKKETKRVRSFLYYFRSLRRRFLDFHQTFSASAFPNPGLSPSHGRWSTFAGEYLRATDHLSQVANITGTQIKKLEAAGITTLTDLATTSKTYVPHLLQPVLQRLKSQAELQRNSKGREKPLYQVRRPHPDDPRRGLALLPPSSPNDVYFDIEGYPLAKDGLEYLLGAVCLENGDSLFFDWWSHDQMQEKESFQAFVDWLHARWKADPSMHVYHYASYETTAMRRLMGKHATREREVDDLLRNQVFVDLLTVVRQGVIIGTSGYSLKDIESLYMEPRKGEVKTAGGSVVAYHAWMESHESPDWRKSPILKEIRDYNQIDCESTLSLANWLRKEQVKNPIKYIPAQGKKNEEKDEKEDHPSTLLAEKLLQEWDATGDKKSARARTLELLAALLGYHWREAKPVFWRMFDRHEMTEQELTDDFDCLAGLQRTGEAARQVKRSRAYRYSFDPNQDTKLHDGSNCFFAHDLSVRVTIEFFDGERGIIEIKLGPKSGEPPKQLSLIPDEHVSAKPIGEAVFRYVEAWSRGTILSSAVDDLLQRRPPRLREHHGGPVIPENADLIPATVQAVRRMDRTVLCIQGPPGTGKTFTAARAILGLLKDGRKVGVTANSHKAILNVLRAVHEALEAEGVHARIIKVGSSEDDPLIENGMIQHVESNGDGFAALCSGPVVIGGSAWLFCRPDFQDELDCLFIDEAGQFSLANTVAVGLATKNLVLVGDQMQLAQPVQGTHPGESGSSCLNYLLAGHATIPPEIGIFLDQTWRLHPSICEFISEAVYEGRLRNHPRTARQRIETNGGLVSKEAGILFLPVEHEGNSQGAEEEANAVGELVQELVGCRVWDADASTPRKLTMDDILLVAPYNMQVRLLKKRLGPGAKVGSVDKFQGQEAQVVIVSMCSSSLDDSPRGAEFLFEPNRLNVAISRAKTLAIVVGSPNLVAARCKTIREMELANLFCWLVDYSRGEA